MPSAKRKKKQRIQESPWEKKFWEIARKHFAEDFPNPTRQGCPSENAIRFLVETPVRGDEAVLNHLSKCSPCYQVFYRCAQEMRAKSKKPPRPKPPKK